MSWQLWTITFFYFCVSFSACHGSSVLLGLPLAACCGMCRPSVARDLLQDVVKDSIWCCKGDCSSPASFCLMQMVHLAGEQYSNLCLMKNVLC